MSKKLKAQYFQVSATDISGYTGASDFNSDGVDLTNFDGAFLVYLNSTHTQGSPTITLEQSDDDTNWFSYKSKAVNIAIPETFIDGEYRPKYLRIAYTANSSNGNVTFELIKIND